MNNNAKEREIKRNNRHKRLRKKIVALDDAFDKIETVYGMGYRWKP